MRGLGATRMGSRLAWFAITAALAALAGCSRAAPAPANSIHLLNAYVMQPGGAGAVAAYLVISNDGGADELISVRSSVGGSVQMLTPLTPGSTAIRLAPAVVVPPHSVLRMSPAGLRLLLTDPGPLRSGKDITLTLVFARAGAITVEAQVTNSETGGSSYFS